MVNTSLASYLAAGIVLTVAGSVHAADKPKTSTPPTVAIANDVLAKLIPHVDRAVREKNVSRSPIQGGPGGSSIEDLPSASVLVGFRYTTMRWSPTITIIRSLQPIYRDAEETVFGKIHGEPAGKPTVVVAKNGYAVGGISVKTGVRVDGFRITFMRVVGKTLDKHKSYTSQWLGGRGGDPEVKLGGDGKIVVGIRVRSGADLDAIGLVQAR